MTKVTRHETHTHTASSTSGDIRYFLRRTLFPLLRSYSPRMQGGCFSVALSHVILPTNNCPVNATPKAGTATISLHELLRQQYLARESNV